MQNSQDFSIAEERLRKLESRNKMAEAIISVLHIGKKSVNIRL